VIALGVLTVVLLVGVVALLPLGLRAGDRMDDAELVGVEPLVDARGVKVVVSNPSELPVLVGIKFRRCGIRLRLEGDSYVRIRTQRTSSDLLPRHMDVVGVIAAGETASFSACAERRLGRRAELVTVVGQDRRLRAIHRRVSLSRPAVGAVQARELPPRVADSRSLR
jgi:hypothetical protein